MFKKQHLVAEVLDERDGAAGLVAGLVVLRLRQGHVPLRVDRVVKVPSGDWGDADAAAEHALRVLPKGEGEKDGFGAGCGLGVGRPH